MIRRILGKILLYAFLVFFVVQYGPDFNFQPLSISSTGGISDFLIYIALGAVLRVIYDIIRKVVRLVTKPLSWISFGIVGVLLNIVTIYGFAYIVSFVVDSGIVIEVGQPLEIVLFSVIIWCIDFLF